MSATTISRSGFPPGPTTSTRPTRTSASRSATWGSRPSAARFTRSRHARRDRRPPILKGDVEVASVDTGDQQRDAHLTAPDFFDAEQHPQISFHSSATEQSEDGSIKLIGEISIKGISRPIELTGTVGEGGEDPWGNERVGFEVQGVIDRREFELKWNQTLPNGNLLVSNEVKLIVSVSAVKAA